MVDEKSDHIEKRLEEILSEREPEKFRCEKNMAGDILIEACRDYRVDKPEVKRDENGKITEIIERDIKTVLSIVRSVDKSIDEANCMIYYNRKKKSQDNRENSYSLYVELTGREGSEVVSGKVFLKYGNEVNFEMQNLSYRIKDFYRRVADIINKRDQQEAYKLVSEVIQLVQPQILDKARLVNESANEFISAYTRLYKSQ